MDADTNLHARNLKLISISFILYWLLGLEQTSDAIRLGILPYKITNPEWLPWLAHFLFGYFIWRYWLNTRKNGSIYTSIRRLQSFDHNSLSSSNITSSEYIKFQHSAKRLYIKRNTNVELDVIAHNIAIKGDGVVKVHYSFDPPKLIDPQNPLSRDVGDIMILKWYNLFIFRLKLIVSKLWNAERDQDRIITWLLACIGLVFSIVNNCLTVFDFIIRA